MGSVNTCSTVGAVNTLLYCTCVNSLTDDFYIHVTIQQQVFNLEVSMYVSEGVWVRGGGNTIATFITEVESMYNVSADRLTYVQ